MSSEIQQQPDRSRDRAAGPKLMPTEAEAIGIFLTDGRRAMEMALAAAEVLADADAAGKPLAREATGLAVAEVRKWTWRLLKVLYPAIQQGYLPGGSDEAAEAQPASDIREGS